MNVTCCFLISGGYAKSLDRVGMNSASTSLSKSDYIACSKREVQLEGNSCVVAHTVEPKVSSNTTWNCGEVSLDLGL
jgi:hypothetical protein